MSFCCEKTIEKKKLLNMQKKLKKPLTQGLFCYILLKRLYRAQYAMKQEIAAITQVTSVEYVRQSGGWNDCAKR